MTTLTIRAERALLGALLAEPGHVHLIARYLTPADFLPGRNATLYARILQLHDGTLPGRPWRQEAARAARLAGMPGTYPGQLEAACPEPSHGLSYGALVMQASTRRALRQMSTALARGNAEIASAMRAHATAFDPDTLHAPAAPSPAPALDNRNAAREETVLAALLQRHPDAGQVLALLPEDAFTSLQRRRIFRALRTLYADGRDVDPLTVDWETARAREDQPAPRPADPEVPGREPSYATRLAAAGIAATAVTQTAWSLAGGLARGGRDQVLPGGTARHGGARLIPPPPGLPGPGQGPAPRM